MNTPIILAGTIPAMAEHSAQTEGFSGTLTLATALAFRVHIVIQIPEHEWRNVFGVPSLIDEACMGL